MILGAEIGLFIYGILILIRGKASLGRTRAVYGTPARLLSLFLLAPFPLSVGIGFVIGFVMALKGKRIDLREHMWTFTFIEAGILVLCVVAFHVIGRTLAQPIRSQPVNSDESVPDRPFE